ncbi:MAG: hypothetical protein N2557_06035 [Hydrogenophilus sp.]|nr:hypothetical protein [Hydrogenophilus sp.]
MRPLFYIFVGDYDPQKFEVYLLHHLADTLNRLGHEAYIVGGRTQGDLLTPTLTYERVAAHIDARRLPCLINPPPATGTDLDFGYRIRWAMVESSAGDGDSQKNEPYWYHYTADPKKLLYINIFSKYYKAFDRLSPRTLIIGAPNENSRYPVTVDHRLDASSTILTAFLPIAKLFCCSTITPLITIARLHGCPVLFTGDPTQLALVEAPEIGILTTFSLSNLTAATARLHAQIDTIIAAIKKRERSLKRFTAEVTAATQKIGFKAAVRIPPVPLYLQKSLPIAWKEPLLPLSFPHFDSTQYQHYRLAFPRFAANETVAEILAEELIAWEEKPRVFFLTLVRTDRDSALLKATIAVLGELLYQEVFLILIGREEIIQPFQSEKILIFPTDQPTEPNLIEIAILLSQNGITEGLLLFIPPGTIIHPLTPFLLADRWRKGFELITFDFDHLLDGQRTLPVLFDRFDPFLYYAYNYLEYALAISSERLKNLGAIVEPLQTLTDLYDALIATTPLHKIEHLHYPALSFPSETPHAIALQNETRHRSLLARFPIPASSAILYDPTAKIWRIFPPKMEHSFTVVLLALDKEAYAVVETYITLSRNKNLKKIIVLTNQSPALLKALLEESPTPFTPRLTLLPLNVEPDSDPLAYYQPASAEIETDHILFLEAGLLPETSTTISELLAYLHPPVAVATPLLLAQNRETVVELGCFLGGAAALPFRPRFRYAHKDKILLHHYGKVPHCVPLPSPRAFATTKEHLFTEGESFLSWLERLHNGGYLVLGHPVTRFYAVEYTLLRLLHDRYESIVPREDFGFTRHLSYHPPDPVEPIPAALLATTNPLFAHHQSLPVINSQAPLLFTLLPSRRKRILFLLDSDPFSEARLTLFPFLLRQKGWFLAESYFLHLPAHLPTPTELLRFAPDILVVSAFPFFELVESIALWKKYLPQTVFFFCCHEPFFDAADPSSLPFLFNAFQFLDRVQNAIDRFIFFSASTLQRIRKHFPTLPAVLLPPPKIPEALMNNFSISISRKGEKKRAGFLTFTPGPLPQWLEATILETGDIIEWVVINFSEHFSRFLYPPISENLRRFFRRHDPTRLRLQLHALDMLRLGGFKYPSTIFSYLALASAQLDLGIAFVDAAGFAPPLEVVEWFVDHQIPLLIDPQLSDLYRSDLPENLPKLSPLHTAEEIGQLVAQSDLLREYGASLHAARARSPSLEEQLLSWNNTLLSSPSPL